MYPIGCKNTCKKRFTYGIDMCKCCANCLLPIPVLPDYNFLFCESYYDLNIEIR